MYMPKKRTKWDFIEADDVKKNICKIVDKLEFEHIDESRIFCVRSQGSKTRAYARVWGLSRIFQVTAGFKPTYVIEVLSEHFDKLNDKEKIKVLIHELMHIPKTFSGSLKSHRGRYHAINSREVDKLFKKMGI